MWDIQSRVSGSLMFFDRTRSSSGAMKYQRSPGAGVAASPASSGGSSRHLCFATKASRVAASRSLASAEANSTISLNKLQSDRIGEENAIAVASSRRTRVEAEVRAQLGGADRAESEADHVGNVCAQWLVCVGTMQFVGWRNRWEANAKHEHSRMASSNCGTGVTARRSAASVDYAKETSNLQRNVR